MCINSTPAAPFIACFVSVSYWTKNQSRLIFTNNPVKQAPSLLFCRLRFRKVVQGLWANKGTEPGFYPVSAFPFMRAPPYTHNREL